MSEPITKVGMRPCHPGEFIREEILRELHLPVARAADSSGAPALSDLVNGKALSPAMALRIEKAFGVSMDRRLCMQVWYRSHWLRRGCDLRLHIASEATAVRLSRPLEPMRTGHP